MRMKLLEVLIVQIAIQSVLQAVFHEFGSKEYWIRVVLTSLGVWVFLSLYYLAERIDRLKNEN